MANVLIVLPESLHSKLRIMAIAEETTLKALIIDALKNYTMSLQDGDYVDAYPILKDLKEDFGIS